MRTMIADRGMGEPISLAAALAAGKKVPPSATGLLAEDHRTVLGWFDWYDAAPDTDRKADVTHRICTALLAHMAAEEDIFYPEAQRETGDEEIVKRSMQEHEGAKRLMGRLERTSPADAQHADVMRELRAEIEAHVDEEESQLFAEVEESGLERYEVGAAVAARRVDRLFELSSTSSEGSHQRLKEYPAMQISEDVARHYFIAGLKNAHASATQGRQMVDNEIGRLVHYPRMKEKLQAHLKEKDAQLERLEKILASCNERPSSMKDTAMALMANISTASSAAAGDEVIKNSFALLGLAKAEAAAFETLILFAQAAGMGPETLRALQQSASEERGMATFVEENLRSVGMGFLQLESQGAPASR